jgi:putative transposase
MSATLLRNTLIEWLDGEPDPVVERILAIDPEYGTLWSIDIAAKRPWPVLREIDEVAGALAERAARLLHADPLPAPRPPLAATATMPGRPARRTRVADDLARRDRAWEAIRPLVEGPTDELFHESTRGPLITARARELGLDRGLLMEYLRRYWRGGQAPDALLPRYRGRVGLNTPSTAPKVGQAKLGRPSGVKVKTGAATGLNVTPAVRERLERGFARWTKGAGAKISKAYERTMATYFRRGFERGPDGELRPLLLPPDERPTVEQFRYHLERWRELRRTGPDGPERETIERVRRRRYNLLLRAIPGDSTRLAFGPGFQWQIDATIGDIYLVHSGDRSRLVGRPVIYLVIDVFSRLIVGFAVLLEGPSWTGARQALANAVADKVALCAQHGVTIEPGEWPVAGCMARAILADRGEFIGVAADTLTAALGTTVLNAAAFRPDWKGIVERQFRIVNDETIAFVPGKVHRRERGERDCRLDAELDIHEFTTLLILGILKHNHSRLRGYNFDAYAIADHVEPYPIDLWDWGIRNRGGALGAVTIEAARRALLPRVTASVTARGIRAPKTDLHYTCARATREGWFSTAREQGVRRVTLAFDPRRTEYAYLDRGEGDLEPCTLLERAATFAGWSWQEAQDYTATRDTGAAQARGRDEQRAANYQAAQDQVVDTGKRKTATARGAAKPTLGETPAARAEENAGLHDHDGLTPADLGIPTGSTAGPAPIATGDDDDYVPPVINLGAYRTTPDPDASGK